MWFKTLKNENLRSVINFCLNKIKKFKLRSFAHEVKSIRNIYCALSYMENYFFNSFQMEVNDWQCIYIDNRQDRKMRVKTARFELRSPRSNHGNMFSSIMWTKAHLSISSFNFFSCCSFLLFYALYLVFNKVFLSAKNA